MADYYGVQATKTLTPTGANIVDPGLLGGRVRCMVDTYEAAAVAAGSTIQMGQALPKGARVLNVILAHDALGAATVDVGDADNADRYIDGADVSSAGVVGSDEAALVDGLAYKVLGTGATASGDDKTILITTISAAITGTIKLIVYYTHD